MFYGDLYPNKECYDDDIGAGLKRLVEARKKFAYGAQRDYFQDRNYIGWVREGDHAHEGCAVLVSNAEENTEADGSVANVGILRAAGTHELFDRRAQGEFVAYTSYECRNRE